MAAAFDLTLIPLYRIKGQEWPQLPGLVAAAPPKRPARGREHDLLVLYLTLAGTASVSSTDYNQISTQMAQRFYQSPGALTSALRAAVEALNQFLLERNQRIGGGKYLIGRLILGVLRENVLTLAQSGPTRVFHLSGGTARPIHEEGLSGRGLGISQAAPLYLAQTETRPGDRLVFCAHLPDDWGSGLPAHNADSLEALRRDLLAATAGDLSAVLLEIQEGKGLVNVLRGDRPVPAPAPVSLAAPDRQPAAAAAPRVTVQPRPPAAAAETAAAVKTAALSPATRLDQVQPGRFVRPLGTRPAPPEASSAAAGPAPRVEPTAPSAPAVERRGRFVAPRPRADIPEIARPPARREFYLGLAKGLRGIRLFSGKISAAFQTFLPRLLPTLEEGEAPRSGSAMLIVALAVPLVVVTVAVIVYTHFGKPSQYEENYRLALAAAESTVGQNDSTLLRHAWESTLDYLDKAEQYGTTPESEALRQQAQAGLDGLDGVIRLDFRPALSDGLDASVRVTRMAAAGNDLYLLDSEGGRVLRAFFTNQGYQQDPAFLCAPGNYDGQTVGALIDLAAMPGGNSRNAAIVAMDSSGTLLFCAPGMTPFPSPLAAPPLGWGRMTGFTLSADGRELFTLDDKAAWIYGYDDEQGTFGEPLAFFGEQVPQNLGAAIDLAADGSDLFLLFADGHVTACTFRLAADTICRDPLMFMDSRPGHFSGAVLPDAVFSQAAFDAPFNTSLYLLEQNTHAVYKLSPHPTSLELDGQFRASVKMEREEFRSLPASALAIGANRILFLCVGNQVYFATMP